MKSRDIAFIEHSLEIRLPSEYKAIVISKNLPRPGNANTPIFDDPKAIVDCNQMYRAGIPGMPKWPSQFFFMGRDKAGACYVIDLTDSKHEVQLVPGGKLAQAQRLGMPLRQWALKTFGMIRMGDTPRGVPIENHRFVIGVIAGLLGIALLVGVLYWYKII